MTVSIDFTVRRNVVQHVFDKIFERGKGQYDSLIMVTGLSRLPLAGLRFNEYPIAVSNYVCKFRISQYQQLSV